MTGSSEAARGAVHDVFITACGAYLPGPPVGNDEIEARLGLIDGKRSRLRARILKSNGITSRHYAIDREGRTSELNEELAAKAARRALERRGIGIERVDMLALGTTLGDVLIPGFASMVHGRLEGPPMEVLSAGGVCCSGMAALAAAYRALRSGTRRAALAGGSELVSRGLRASRYARSAVDKPADGGVDFDAEFIRFMLSDGAGVVLLEPQPSPVGVSLRVDFIDLVSHAGEQAACMHAGTAESGAAAGRTWLDYPTIAEAERAGLLQIRQDARRLDRVVQLGLEHWLRLVKAGWFAPDRLDYVLCHHSSRFFQDRFTEALVGAGLMPERSHWFTNLYERGNTGAAAIFVALEELWSSGRLRTGDRILLGVPESARFTTCIAHLTCVGAGDGGGASEERGAAAREGAVVWTGGAAPAVEREPTAEREPAQPDDRDALLRSPLPAGGPVGAPHARLLVELALVWAEFERMLARVPIVRRIESGEVTLEEYRKLLCHLRQQVVDGASWITRAAAHLSEELLWLRTRLIQHAADEQRDYELLERDFASVGGALETLQQTDKNVGSEALSGFIFHRAGLPDPVDLVGAMFIIEGLGVRKASGWAEQLARALKLRRDQLSFLSYHGQNDASHFDRLEEIVQRLRWDDARIARTVKTARVVARLYALQLEEVSA